MLRGTGSTGWAVVLAKCCLQYCPVLGRREPPGSRPHLSWGGRAMGLRPSHRTRARVRTCARGFAGWMAMRARL